MTIGLLEKTVGIIVVALLMRLVITISDSGTSSIWERLKTNIWERSKTLAIMYLVVCTAYMFVVWTETYEVYWTVTAKSTATGVAVAVAWIWTVVIALIAPAIAGFKKWVSVLVSTIMLATVSVTILTLL